MIELGLTLETVLPWFTNGTETSYTRVSVPAIHSATWPAILADAVRRAYIADAKLEQLATANNMSQSEVLSSKLPNPGSVMSGDFGEIVAYIYLAGIQGGVIIGPKRWRLKADRTKSAPFSDIVQFTLASWPIPSDADAVVCAEVKAKATGGAFDPIADAIEGMEKDRTSRLARTLVWLRERAIADDIGAVTIPQLERFIHATGHPPYNRHFNAIAVICTSLVHGILDGFTPPTLPDNCALIVMDVPDLYHTYSAVFEAVQTSVPTAVPEGREVR